MPRVERAQVEAGGAEGWCGVYRAERQKLRSTSDTRYVVTSRSAPAATRPLAAAGPGGLGVTTGVQHYGGGVVTPLWVGRG